MTRQIPRTASHFCGLVLCLFGVLGCGGGDNVEISLLPVTGTVLADGQPVANAAVTFAPYGAQVGRPAYGRTDESGKYELAFVDGRPGCPPGNYIVTISKFAQPDGSAFPANVPPEEQTAIGVEHIPPQYSDPTKTKLLAEVSPQGGDIPFEISMK
ncbi:carboxypeptidase-like regulatory domain-containing protein [Rubinisphaera margarita]|uniref:carboxypeptidase-like regulatory domain-containing protein n=1 Tax=Rubinisphaera margarita TaxID=2909586 RepID=UPI001EE86625|nr:carboxypeptidase-like regulatory domain-containing protein [Rubinisphaera margarita]MCG6155528.1 carboxypeptidase-like regulatory domain-containing protein [Rubinisphaera margarita]